MQPIALHSRAVGIYQYSFPVFTAHTIFVLDEHLERLSQLAIEANIKVYRVVLQDIRSFGWIWDNAFHFGLVALQGKIADDGTESVLEESDNLLLRFFFRIFDHDAMPLSFLRAAPKE